MAPKNRLLRTTSFRLTLTYVGLFSASAIVLFGFVYWVSMSALRESAVSAVESELGSLEVLLSGDRADALAAEISQRIQLATYRDSRYLLLDAGGHRLAGDIDVSSAFDGWLDLPGPEPKSRPRSRLEHPVLAFGKRLPDGRFLAVGTDTYRIEEAEEAMLEAFGWGLGATLVLALSGGAVLSRRFLRRVDQINRAIRRIMHGDLSQRIETRSTEDELDELVAQLNDMLERLQHLVESMRQVSNDIAHDLRTPLGRVRQRLETARTNARTLADYENAVDQALADTDATLATFSALLRIAQVESGSTRISFAQVDLSALLMHLVGTYSAVAEDSGKRMTSSIAGEIIVEGDRELLTQMLVNLIENALRHSASEATVEIELHNDDGGPIVVISDDGPGIPPEAREKVFRRFYRLDRSRSTPGSGLGLALVAGIAQLHQIRVVLSDREPGARVTLQFGRAV